MNFDSFDFQVSDNSLRNEYTLETTGSSGEMQHSLDSTNDFFSFVNASAPFSSAGGTEMHNLQEEQQKLSAMHQLEGGYSIPQLTPDARDAYTNSSVLTGHNPEYSMSPLQISGHYSNVMHHRNDEDGKDFTPLVSPAIDPSFDSLNRQGHNLDNTFSPLTSPALHAAPQSLVLNDSLTLDSSESGASTEEILKQRLEFLNRQQQQLLEDARRQFQGHSLLSGQQNGNQVQSGTNLVNSPHLHASLSSNSAFPPPSPASLPTASASMSSSSELVTTTPGASSRDGSVSHIPRPQQKITASIAPATPSLLMKLGNGGGIASHMATDMSAAVDELSFLPDAMLQDKKHTTPATITPAKRRRLSSRPNPSFTSPGLLPTAHMSPRSFPTPVTDSTIAALVSPAALRPQIMPTHGTASPRCLKPLISPSLKPDGKPLSTLEEEAAVAALESKSNYENMREGKAKILGIDFPSSFQSGVENRRSAHKAAEQKRRDTLKQSFDSLRKEIADALVDKESVGAEKDEETMNEMKAQKEKEVKQMSKVLLIQHSYEYILQLKENNRKKDNRIESLEKQLKDLQSRLEKETKRESEKGTDKEEVKEKE